MGSKPGALIKTFLEIRQFELFWFSDILLLFYFLDFASNKHTPATPTP